MVGATFGLGGLVGIIQAVATPSGWVWTSVRALVFAVFVVAVVLWIAAVLRGKRSRMWRAP
jgi:uncharacterized membrane protein